jgi:hypothetical protein
MFVVVASNALNPEEAVGKQRESFHKEQRAASNARQISTSLDDANLQNQFHISNYFPSAYLCLQSELINKSHFFSISTVIHLSHEICVVARIIFIHLMSVSNSQSPAPSRGDTPNPNNPRFTPQLDAEDLLKASTEGLVTLSDFRKRRNDAFEQKAVEGSRSPGTLM